jgi:hypothetical protein
MFYHFLHGEEFCGMLLRGSLEEGVSRGNGGREFINQLAKIACNLVNYCSLADRDEARSSFTWLWIK